MKIVDISYLIGCGKYIYDKMTEKENSVDRSWEYCHSAFLKIKNKYNDPKTDMSDEEKDFLCLCLGWYLASWGMLRNSFLNKYSHKIHWNVIDVIYDERWDDLWDVDYRTLTADQAKRIVTLSDELEEIYKSQHDFEKDDYRLTDTLKTKILLGTIACVPAYDQFFVCAIRHSLEQSKLSEKSILKIKKVYTNYISEFSAMKSYCGQGNYPPAKLLDMCFFEYGVRLSKIEKATKEVIKMHGFNSRNREGRDMTNLICLYVVHKRDTHNIQVLADLYNANSELCDSMQREVMQRLI